jgi:hypothetical protein
MYRRLVKAWFSTRVEQNDLREMIAALENADVRLFERLLRHVVARILSFHDLSGPPEKVYHALVLGMLVWMSGKYDIRSNRESGLGRFDLMLKPKAAGKPGILMEFKKVDADAENAHEPVLKAALAQIDEKGYAAELAAAGVEKVLKIAVAFRGKQLWLCGGTSS